MSKIEWTDKTLNFVSGCTKASAGCQNCYAEKMHRRLHSMHQDCETCKHGDWGTNYYSDTVENCNHPKFKRKGCPKNKPKGYEKPFNKIVCDLTRLEEGLKKLDKVDYYGIFAKYRDYTEERYNQLKFRTKTQARNWIAHPDQQQNWQIQHPSNFALVASKISKSYKIFVNSMSDTFHEDISYEDIKKAFLMMAEYPQHTFQVLTKRYENMFEYVKHHEIPKNVHLGISISDNKDFKNFNKGWSWAYWRYELPKIFVSFEPLLEEIKKERFHFTLEDTIKNIFDWVIVGGESGNKARPMSAEWVRNIRDLCQQYKVPFFFKQYSQYKRYAIFGEDYSTGEYQSGYVRERNGKAGYYFTGNVKEMKLFTKAQAHKYLKDKVGLSSSAFSDYMSIHLGDSIIHMIDYKNAILDGKKYQEYPKENKE